MSKFDTPTILRDAIISLKPSIRRFISLCSEKNCWIYGKPFELVLNQDRVMFVYDSSVIVKMESLDLTNRLELLINDFVELNHNVPVIKWILDNRRMYIGSILWNN